MRFMAIDVEAANSRYRSICQIGVVLFEDGREVGAEGVYVDPREEFGSWQVRVHDIRPEHIAGSPCFAGHYDWLLRWTGGELCLRREDAADMAAEAGAEVVPNVTKKTTMLVVGERDPLPGWQAKSGKQRRAEVLMEQGVPIRIVAEQDFLAAAAIKA